MCGEMRDRSRAAKSVEWSIVAQWERSMHQSDHSIARTIFGPWHFLRPVVYGSVAL